MRSISFSVFWLAAAAFCAAQQAPAPSPGLPSDPHAILDAARPLYDFNSADLKPWHFKVSYQLYDDKETPTEQGTFEYWWAAPHVDRSTWTRGAVSYSAWNLPENGSAHLGPVEMLSYPESKLKSALLSPLPSQLTLHAETTQLEKHTYGKDANALQCVMVSIKMKNTSNAPMGLFPTYCFSPQQPILFIDFGFSTPIVEYSSIAKIQNRYFAKQVTILSPEKKKLLTATLDFVNGIAPTDAALTPPAEAKAVYPPKLVAIPTKDSGSNVQEPASTEKKVIKVPSDEMKTQVLKKVQPKYPEDAKHARISGTVVLQATIGTDGWVHDLHVLSAPAASMAASALGAASQWRYKPYRVNGEPVEVQTEIQVIYSLSF